MSRNPLNLYAGAVTTKAMERAAYIDRRVMEVATYDNATPDYIRHQAEIMVKAGYANMEVALATLSLCVRNDEMTPLEIAAKAYEKYATVIFAARGENVSWENLSITKQTAFLSLSEESNRLYLAQKPKTIDQLKADINGTVDDIPF